MVQVLLFNKFASNIFYNSVHTRNLITQLSSYIYDLKVNIMEVGCLGGGESERGRGAEGE